jgi:hypothetical protein
MLQTAPPIEFNPHHHTRRSQLGVQPRRNLALQSVDLGIGSGNLGSRRLQQTVFGIFPRFTPPLRCVLMHAARQQLRPLHVLLQHNLMLLHFPQELQVVDRESCSGSATTFLLHLATAILFIELLLNLTQM